MSDHIKVQIEIKKGVFDNDMSGTTHDVIVTKKGVMYMKKIKVKRRKSK